MMMAFSMSLVENPNRVLGRRGSLKQYQDSDVLYWHEFEVLRDVDLEEEQLGPFFRKRPQLIVNRMLEVSKTLYQAQNEWNNRVVEEVSSVNKKHSTDGDASKKLCQAVSSLGPVAVKMGQTLSQRPDLVGAEAAKALKTLQTQNTPFDDQLAYAVLHESLDYWDGPIAPGIELDDATLEGFATYNPRFRTINAQGPTRFASMTAHSVASASLGQVYKATTHEGADVAVKVQRPDALSTLAKDAQCFRLLVEGRNFVENAKTKIQSPDSKGEGFTEAEVRGGQSTFGSVLDRVSFDIKKELDYRIEAENSKRFRESLAFLGFVTTPEVVEATDRVLITEWIPGRHLRDLSKDEGLAMTRMAVEACTASMVLTGFVHADPHEGNLMLHDDGRLVFLDFGLMSEVEDSVMEGFAKGIQGLLSENWMALTEAFVDVGFVNDPIMHRNSLKENWRVDPNFGLPQLARDLENAMKTTDGGSSRFGALATVLNKKISPNWLVFTPPYVILLIRTFLTLEGIAGSIDPTFNIYEMAMPWAIQRTLSPSTEQGIQVFRSTILTEENTIQWDRLVSLMNMNNGSPTEHAPTEVKKSEVDSANAKQAAMNDAIQMLLGSSSGRPLRRALRDLDSVDLLRKLSSREARPILESVIQKSLDRRRVKRITPAASSSVEESSKVDRPLSEECKQMRTLQSKRRKQAMRVLLRDHLRRCFLCWRGLKATFCFVSVSLRVFVITLVRTYFQRRKERSGTKTSRATPGI